MHLATY